MDSLIKPTTEGFEADTLLRSVESPRRLYFKVGLPAGASLVQAKDGAGIVDVVKEGAVMMIVLPVSARDAAGSSVPVSMSVSGDTLVLSVEDRSAEVQYPLEVDPTFIEEHYTPSGSKRSNWQWETSNSSRFASKPTDNTVTKELSEASPGFLETYGTAAYAESEKAYWAYQTQGVSKIYMFTAETEAKNTEDHIESFLELEAHGTGANESKEPLSNEAEKTSEYSRKPAGAICPKNSEGVQECTSTAGGAGNAVRFQQSVVNKPTSKYSFSDFLYKGEVYLSEPPGTHATTKENTSSPEFEIEVENAKKEKVKEKRANALYGSSTWLSEYHGALEFIAEDPGIGVAATKLEYESAPGAWEQLTEHNYLTEGNCTGVQCNPKHNELWTLNTKLPNGADKIRYRAEDAMGAATHETESLTTEGTATIKVDYSKPHDIFLSGLPYGNELTQKSYELAAYAGDGEGLTVPSSGVASIEVYVDGKSIKALNSGEGKCTLPRGECTASAKYKIEGSELGAGHHAIVIVVKDNAGNEEREEETISIRHSTPVPMAPGSLDLQSGDFTLDPSDVSLGSGLSVSRVYSSRDLTAGGEASLLGPQWSLSTGSEETLTEMVNHSVLVTSGTGEQTIFAAILNSKQEPTGKFEVPPGDSNLTMTLEENGQKEKVAYYLKDPAANSSTKFSPSSTPTVWLPEMQEGPVATATVTYLYETVEVGGKKVTRPKEELAAHPKVSCPEKAMVPGCRALKFTYATKTKAEIGEGPSEWGEYEHHLTKVSYEGYNPATKKMTETPVPVAEYVYDKQGRLRAEWDPRISPALKTTYGYDTEGHVVTVNPPGQQPWLLHYGTIAGDTGTGRLLSVTRPPASTPAELEKADGYALPVNTSAPTLSSTTPVEGTSLTVTSHGTWSNSPLSYNYQWETCLFKSCKAIPGATSTTFTPSSSQYHNELRVKVTATNDDGAALGASAETGEVKNIAPTYVTEFGKGTLSTKVTSEYSLYSGATAVAVDPSGNVWVLNTNSAEAVKAYVYNSSGTTLLHTYTVTGRGVGTSIAINQSTGKVYVGDAENNKVWELSSTGEAKGSIKLKGFEQEKEGGTGKKGWVAVAIDSSGNVWTTSRNSGYAEEFTETGEFLTQFLVGQEEGAYGPDGIVVTHGYLYIKLYGSKSNVVKYNYEGKKQWQPEDVRLPPGMALEPKNSYMYAFEGKNAYEYLLTEGKEQAESSCSSSSCQLATFGSEKLTEPLGLGVNTTAHDLYVVDHGTGEVEEWTAPNPEFKPPPPPTIGANAVTTIEYQVPLSGSSGLQNMTSSEVAKWGQKSEEAPVEATAIFPPDSPQNWPPASYTRANVYYLDEHGRLVNVATPSSGTYGAVSTTEYNETNDVVRTLSPDNRATALAAGSKSEEVASLVSTFNTYRNKCSAESEFAEERESTEPGTRLCETEGPAHAVKYTAGKEQLEATYARKHATYFYDQKVPAEGPNKESFSNVTFNLSTKTQVLTKIVNSKGEKLQEVEPRATVTSYSGQNNLGWKLREPTSTTVDPEGVKSTDTTLYYEEGNEAMGQVMETRGPKGPSGNSAYDQKIVYYSQEENKEHTECGQHPEWAGLVCETLPSKQPPETTGLPKLPETITTYNIWDEPETVVKTFPKDATFAQQTRTKKEEYDAAGRMTTSEVTSTATTETTDKKLPKVTNLYNEKTGILEKQSTTVGEKTKTITSTYNTLGQPEGQTDADGNVAKFKWGGPETDGLLAEMSDGSHEGKSSQKYTYSATTKQLATLVDSAAGTFTAAYDTEGKLASEIYPNGMCAIYTHNSIGEATHVAYTKTTSCSETQGVWFSESTAPSVRGEAMSRTSTLSSESYTYDSLGRLTETQETPAGQYCKTRIYSYDEESNRIESIAREPNSKKECATEGGTVEKHTFDEANRLTDAGITYDPLGNVTKLPASDAEGHALESSFYADNAVATQTQNGVTNNYYLDPAGRIRETITGAKKVITHYDSSGEAIAWICEGAEKAEACETTANWTRNIPGIDGALTAIQNGTGATAETPILQLHDLEGNVVATMKDKTGETTLESTYNSTEFGVPNAGKEPPKYAWLGAGGVERSLASGVVTEGATSYVPQTGMALQSEQVAPPGLPGGSGAGAPYIFQEEPWVLQGATREANEAPGLEAGREKEAAEAACRANILACPVEIEDPHWIWTFTIAQAQQLAGEFEYPKALSFTKVGDDLKALFGIDFAAQVEAKVEQAIAGFDQGEVEDWAYNIGRGLSVCVYDAEIKLGHPHNPHCWVYVTTNRYHVGIHSVLGFIGAIFELPAFKKEAQVAYCLKGATYCYEV